MPIKSRDLKTINLQPYKKLIINSAEIPVFKSGNNFLYVTILDLNESVNGYYPQTLNQIETESILRKKISLGKIDYQDGTISELPVIHLKNVKYWLFTITTGSPKRHKMVMKCLDDLYYELRKI